jgi:hypothetical protein
MDGYGAYAAFLSSRNFTHKVSMPVSTGFLGHKEKERTLQAALHKLKSFLP